MSFANHAAALVLLSVGLAAGSATAADDPPAPKPVLAPAAKPMIVHNPNGSFTIQKPASKDTKAKSGLVIPPQVVTPLFSTPDKKPKN
jgi:hypothetical protein